MFYITNAVHMTIDVDIAVHPGFQPTLLPEGGELQILLTCQAAFII